jgi:glucose-6-phosphate-specific signal transduction histidine kinase
MVPVQFFQSVIAVELAIVGALLWQIRFFDKEDNQAETSRRDPRLQLLMLVVLTAILFGSLEALREGGGQLAAVLLTVGLAVSLLPILLRVLRPVRRDATMQPRNPQLWVTLVGLILFAAVVVLLIFIG